MLQEMQTGVFDVIRDVDKRKTKRQTTFVVEIKKDQKMRNEVKTNQVSNILVSQKFHFEF